MLKAKASIETTHKVWLKWKNLAREYTVASGPLVGVIRDIGETKVSCEAVTGY